MKVYFTTEAVESAAFLADVLSREGHSPESVRKTAQGKPYLADMGASFNVTHTEGLTAVAIGNVEVGIDAERKNARKPSAVMRRLTPLERAEDFFTLWTAKEAYVKYRGSTLAAMLSSLTYENGTLLESGAPVNITLQHFDLANCTLCVCTREREAIVFIKL